MSKFTEKQLQNWQAFERVREEGKFNMLDLRAQRGTGLSSDEYFFVLENYSELREVVEAMKRVV